MAFLFCFWFLFQKTWKWENNAPIAFQYFLNVNFGTKCPAFFTHYHVTLTQQSLPLLLSTQHDSSVDIDDRLSSDPFFVYLRDVATERIHPIPQGSASCVLMLMTNLASPCWMSVECDQKFLSDFFCSSNVRNVTTKPLPKTVVQAKWTCNSLCVIFGHKCISVLWSNSSEDPVKSFCPRPTAEDFQNFMLLLKTTIKANMPGFMSEHPDSRSPQMLNSTLGLFMAQQYDPNHIVPGLRLCSFPPEATNIGSDVFMCQNGAYISSAFVCDGVLNCLFHDQSDEAQCCTEVLLGQQTTCALAHHLNPKQVSPIFTDDKMTGGSFKHKTFVCSNGELIPSNFVNDLFADCGKNYEDEAILSSLLLHKESYECTIRHQIPCREGHPRCYNLSSICNYTLNLYNQLFPCRNGGHLASCEEFECNKMFKCQDSYCIPWQYTCDGKWDCSDGIDESHNFICENMEWCAHFFRCQETKICVHLAGVCDGLKDCPVGDDELLCELHNVKCPYLCHCLALTMVCAKTNLLLTSVMLPHLAVSMSFSQIDVNILRNFDNLVYLKIRSCNISKICNYILSMNLLSLDLGYNLLAHIPSLCFEYLSRLRCVFLNDNNVVSVGTHAFTNLSAFRLLNLSNNQLTFLPSHLVPESLNMTILSVLNNSFSTINKDTFFAAQITVIQTSDFHICCIAPSQTMCQTERLWYMSCSNLLPNNATHIVSIVISVLIIILNSFSGCLHHFAREKNVPYCRKVVCINTTEIVFGLYLCVIWVATAVFGSAFAVRETMWRCSIPCWVALNLALFHSILMPLSLLLLALARLMVVMHPVTTSFKRTDFVTKLLVVMFAVTCVCCGVVTTLLKAAANSVPNNLCSPFVDPGDAVLVVEIVTWLVGSLQTSFSVVIAITNSCLVYKYSKSQHNIQKCKSKHSSQALLRTQLVLTTASNIFCWFTTSIIHLTAIVLRRYPPDLVIWTTVTVAPMNSVMNPAVFVVTAVRRWRATRNKYRQPHLQTLSSW